MGVPTFHVDMGARNPLITLNEDHMETKMAAFASQQFMPYAELVSVERPKAAPLRLFLRQEDGGEKLVKSPLDYIEDSDRDKLFDFLKEQARG